MTTYTQKQLKEMNPKQLAELVAVLRHELQTLRFKDASGELKQVAEISRVRKTIARAMTLLAPTVGLTKPNVKG